MSLGSTVDSKSRDRESSCSEYVGRGCILPDCIAEMSASGVSIVLVCTGALPKGRALKSKVTVSTIVQNNRSMVQNSGIL